MTRILVVDDEELIIKSFPAVLRREGYEVVATQSSLEALKKVEQEHFDLIITDIRMPDLNGIDMLSRIREILNRNGRAQIPEICVTGYAEDWVVNKAKELHVADYLEKPFDVSYFLGRIKRVLNANRMEYFAYSQNVFIYKYVVMLTDTDQFKHMSFANYLKLMFLATDALLTPVINPAFLMTYRLKVKNSRMQFKKQSAPGDVILVKVNASEVNVSNFSLLYTFLVEGSAELVGLGRQSYELLDLKTNVTETIPEQMRNVLLPIRVEESNLVYKY